MDKMKLYIMILLFLVKSPEIKSENFKPGEFIYKVTITEEITPASMEKLKKAIEKANQDQAKALLVFLDTPGGLMSSMDEMVKDIFNSKVPIITFVAPPGATCGSAGVFILLSSHIAAMAPATNIGSATPISIGTPMGPQQDKRENDSDAESLKKKILNHAKAKIQAIAEYHNRNTEFAIKTVSEAANIPSTKALEIRLVDVIATTQEELLKKIDGKTVKTIEGEKTLKTKDITVIDIKDDLRNRILRIIANPYISYLLIMFGILGIFVEIQNPGLILPGVIGAISLLLGLYGLQTIPVNFTGFLLIILGIIMLILEIKILSYGALSLGGLISIIIGIILLAESFDNLKMETLIFLSFFTFLVAGLIVWITYKVVKVSRRKSITGNEALLSEIGEAITDITPISGKIFIHGEYWNAISEDKTIPRGKKVKPLEIQGLTIKVKEFDRFS